MAYSFKNKVVLVTGSNRGIGKATVMAFAKQGAKVIIHYRSNQKLADEVFKKVSKLTDALLVQADVSIPSDVANMFAAIKKRFGKLDILVNNAGNVDKLEPFLQMKPEVWHEPFLSNLDGTFFCSQQAVRAMQKRKGVIINLGSVRALPQCGRDDGLMGYNVAKAGVIALTQHLAKFLAPDIRVNCVSPGLVEVEWLKDEPHLRTLELKRTPLQKIATTDDIVHTILFLASDEAGHITGQNIFVDGGVRL